MAIAAKATGHDPLSLLRLIHEAPDVFDSIWYSAFPPERPGFDIDKELHRGS